jgi:predicted ATPase
MLSDRSDVYPSEGHQGVNKRFVITGAPGGGKTPVLKELVAMGFTGVPEPAREVLAEQRAVGGTGVPEKDPTRFCDLMLARAIDDFGRSQSTEGPVFFDRGIPDHIGYFRLFGLDASSAEQAATLHRYNDLVFVMPSWPEIYTTDEERKMTFEMAHALGEVIRDVYVGLGYTLVEVPRDTPRARAHFIAARVADQ